MSTLQKYKNHKYVFYFYLARREKDRWQTKCVNKSFAQQNIPYKCTFRARNYT